MNRDEILQKSRPENKDSDEYEQYARAQGGQWAMVIGGLVCMLIALFEAILNQARFSAVPWCIYLSMVGTSLFVSSRCLQQPKKMAVGALVLVLAAVLFVLHIMDMIG